MKNDQNHKTKTNKDLNQEEYHFSDIGGNSEAKTALLDMIEVLKNPSFYRENGVQMPKGVLF